MPTRIIIAEDETIIRVDLKEELLRQGYLVVGDVGDGQSAAGQEIGLQVDDDEDVAAGKGKGHGAAPLFSLIWPPFAPSPAGRTPLRTLPIGTSSTAPADGS